MSRNTNEIRFELILLLMALFSVNSNLFGESITIDSITQLEADIAPLIETRRAALDQNTHIIFITEKIGFKLDGEVAVEEVRKGEIWIKGGVAAIDVTIEDLLDSNPNKKMRRIVSVWGEHFLLYSPETGKSLYEYNWAEGEITASKAEGWKLAGTSRLPYVSSNVSLSPKNHEPIEFFTNVLKAGRTISVDAKISTINAFNNDGALVGRYRLSSEMDLILQADFFDDSGGLRSSFNAEYTNTTCAPSIPQKYSHEVFGKELHMMTITTVRSRECGIDGVKLNRDWILSKREIEEIITTQKDGTVQEMRSVGNGFLDKATVDEAIFSGSSVELPDEEGMENRSQWLVPVSIFLLAAIGFILFYLKKGVSP